MIWVKLGALLAADHMPVDIDSRLGVISTPVSVHP